jgi:hypothetical protein
MPKATPGRERGWLAQASFNLSHMALQTGGCYYWGNCTPDRTVPLHCTAQHNTNNSSLTHLVGDCAVPQCKDGAVGALDPQVAVHHDAGARVLHVLQLRLQLLLQALDLQAQSGRQVGSGRQTDG